MTVQDAINAADALRPNDFTLGQKCEWLNELDGQIFRELILSHNAPIIEDFSKHTGQADTLLVPFPDTGLYPLYLVMRFDLHNGETAKYANSAAAFEAAYQTFANYYNRTHYPVCDGRLRF